MKSIVIFIAAIMLGHITTAQNLKVDTVKDKGAGVIRYMNYGPVGLEIFPTDSTPARRLMIADMDIPLVGAWFLSEPLAKEKEVRMNIDDVKRLFFDNPEIEVVGRCSAEDVMGEETYIPDSTTLFKVRISPNWQITDHSIFLRLQYYVRGTIYDGGVCINLFLEFDFQGNLKRRFVVNGTGNESVLFSRDGSMVYFASYSISELISWTPCTDGDIILWDLNSNEQLFSYNNFDKSCFLTEQGYSANIHFTGNNLIYTFFHHKKHVTDSVRFYRIVDFRNEKSYLFSIPAKSTKSLKLLPNGVEFQRDGEAIERHVFGSSFFHQ